jgi:hypothetical protein
MENIGVARVKVGSQRLTSLLAGGDGADEIADAAHDRVALLNSLEALADKLSFLEHVPFTIPQRAERVGTITHRRIDEMGGIRLGLIGGR